MRAPGKPCSRTKTFFMAVIYEDENISFTTPINLVTVTRSGDLGFWWENSRDLSGIPINVQIAIIDPQRATTFFVTKQIAPSSNAFKYLNKGTKIYCNWLLSIVLEGHFGKT